MAAINKNHTNGCHGSIVQDRDLQQKLSTIIADQRWPPNVPSIWTRILSFSSFLSFLVFGSNCPRMSSIWLDMGSMWLSRGVSVRCGGGGLCQGDPWTEIPLYGKERVVCILLECILVFTCRQYLKFRYCFVFYFSFRLPYKLRWI